MSDQAFEDWKQKARGRDLVEVATGLGKARLKRSGQEWMGPCPQCGGTDKFSINPKKQKWLCRNVAKPEQNSVGLLMHCLDIEFMEAAEMINGEPPPNSESYRRPVNEEAERELEQRRRDEDRERAAAEQKQANRKMATAADVFGHGRLIAKTHTERYLKARGIELTAEQAKHLRHADALEYRGRPHPDIDADESLGEFPAMLAAIRRADGALIGLHRTYLDPGFPRKLIPPGDPKMNAAKKAWGVVKHGSILLSDVSRAMAIGEGIETTASWFSMGLGPDDCGIAAAVSLGNLAGSSTGTIQFSARDTKGKVIETYHAPNGKPASGAASEGIELWEEVKEVIILGDHDWGHGRLAAWQVEKKQRNTIGYLLTAARRFRAQGRTVFVHMAPEGMDWNDALRFEGELQIPPLLTFEEFDAWAEKILDPPFFSRFGAMTLAQLDEPGEELQFLIDNFFTVGEKSVIGGESRSGKSFLAIHAAMSIALDRLFFGQKVKPGLVIYQAGEGAKGIKKRLRAYLKHNEIELQGGEPFVLLKHKIDIYSADGDTEGFIEECLAHAKRMGVRLQAIFIDTLATAQGAADENSGKDMGMVMSNIDKINARTGAHVCLVHHMNKNGGKLRGHSSIYANVDQVVLVSRDETTKVRTAMIDKQKDDVDSQRFQFELLSVHLGESDTGRPITSCVVVDVGSKQRFIEQHLGAAGPKAFKLNNTEAEFFRALLDSIKAKGEQAPSELQLPLGHQVARVENFRETFDQTTASGLDIGAGESEEQKKRNANNVRSRLRYTAQSLKNFGVIGLRKITIGDEERSYLWHTGKAIRGFPDTYEKVQARPAGSDEGAPIAGGGKAKPTDDVLPF